MPTALITGGAGFIGSHVAERFLREGWTVHVVDNLASGKRENIPAAATFHELDIREAPAAALVGTLKPDVLVHLAAERLAHRFDGHAVILSQLMLSARVIRAASPGSA